MSLLPKSKFLRPLAAIFTTLICLASPFVLCAATYNPAFNLNLDAQAGSLTSPGNLAGGLDAGAQLGFEWQALEWEAVGLQAAFDNFSGAPSFSTSSLDGTLRFSAPLPLRFQPYLMLGGGYNILNSGGPVGHYHAMASLGGRWIFDPHWAADLGLGWQIFTPIANPPQSAFLKLGLSYTSGPGFNLPARAEPQPTPTPSPVSTPVKKTPAKGASSKTRAKAKAAPAKAHANPLTSTAK